MSRQSGLVKRVAYAARSNRTNEVALERFCTHFNFEPEVFDAVDATGRPIYHTNVLMCVGADFCLIGLDTIRDPARRAEIADRLAGTGRAVMVSAMSRSANSPATPSSCRVGAGG